MFRPATSPPKMFTLICLSGLSVVSLNMFVASLGSIGAELEADYSLVNLSIAGYAAMTAVLQLLMGPLSDRFGRRPIALAALVIFTVASLGAMLAGNIWVFLFFRLLQAAITSGWVLSNAVVRDTLSEREAASLLGYLAMAWAIAPMLGPMFGGILDEVFGWRANFAAFSLFGVAIFLMCWSDLGETNKSPSTTFLQQFRAYPELFSSRRFWGYAVCMAFSTGAFYAFLGGVPFVAGAMFGLSSATLGFYMGTITAGFFLGSYLSGRFASRFRLTTMILAGRIAACIGLAAGLMLFWAGYVHVFSLFGACMFVGLGNGLTMPGCSAGAMSVRPRLAGSASGLAGSLTVGGGAVMSSATGAVVSTEHGAYSLLGMMLLSTVLATVAALYVLWVEREGGDKG